MGDSRSWAHDQEIEEWEASDRYKKAKAAEAEWNLMLALAYEYLPASALMVGEVAFLVGLKHEKITQWERTPKNSESTVERLRDLMFKYRHCLPGFVGGPGA